MRVPLLLVLVLVSFQVFADPEPGIKFIENKNQWPDQFLFGADVRSGKVLFARDRISFSFFQKQNSDTEKNGNGTPHSQARSESGVVYDEVHAHLYEVRFVNANQHAAVRGGDITPTKYNYFLGNDKSKWASNAATFYSIYYETLYPGIDMRYYSQKDRMKYEWIVSPETSPDIIAMHYDGVKTMYLDNENLHIETSVNEIWEMKPYAFQWIDGKKVNVPCRYELKNNVVSYSFPEGYDVCSELVIDPILIFSAYSGSTLDNWGNTATYDNRGNVYSGGMVTNNGFQSGYPLTPGAYQLEYGGGTWDVGILKYDSAGSQLLYCTYIGGNGTETPQSLVTNSKGELLILGATGSADFPVTNGSTFQGGEDIDPLWGVPYTQGTDLFVLKLSATGDALLGGTYLGGTANDGVNFISGSMSSPFNKVESPLARNYGDQLRGDIITDENDLVYIASNTLSHDFPAANAYHGGSHDAVVVKLEADLSTVIWSRFVGGTGTDAAYSVKLDQNNNVFLSGGSTSPVITEMNGLKTTNQGGGDGWIMSLTNDGLPIDGTFLGTPQYDQSYFIDFNDQGEVFAFGQTLGNYAPGQAGKQFVHKLSHNLKTSYWVRLIGPGIISPTAFLVSDCSYIYISGWGGEINDPIEFVEIEEVVHPIYRNYIGGSTVGFPVTADAYQSQTSGNDFYFLVLSEDGTQNLYGTFLGGTQSGTHVDGGTSRFDKLGIVYHAVCAGCGGYSDFPAVNVPFEHQRNRSTRCNNAVFKFDLSLLKARLQTNSLALNKPGLNKICLEDPIVFQNLSFGGETFEWDLGDGTKLTKFDTTHFAHVYKNTGRYKVWLKAIDRGTCKVKDSTFTFVDVFTPNVTIKGDAMICAETSHQLEASGAASYQWMSEDGSFVSSLRNPVVSPLQTTKYFLTAAEANGCTHEDTVTVHVTPVIKPEFEMERKGDCTAVPSVTVKDLTEKLSEEDHLYFDFGDGNTSELPEYTHQYKKGGVYTIKLIAEHESCITEKAVTMGFEPLKIPNVITPGEKENKNDVFTIQVGDVTGKTPAAYDLKTRIVIYNRWGKEVYKNPDYQYDWSGEDLEGAVYFYEVTVHGYATCKGWLHLIK